MKPGDIYWYDFPKPEAGQKVMAYRHMVAILNDPKNSLHTTLHACPISSATKYAQEIENQHPSIVLISKSKYSFLTKDSVILADQIFCLTSTKLQRYVGSLDEDDLDELRGAVYDVLELGELELEELD